VSGSSSISSSSTPSVWSVAASKRARQPASGSGPVTVAEDESMSGGYPAAGSRQPAARNGGVRMVVVEGRAALAAPLQASTA
jgi:hypothetical protein